MVSKVPQNILERGQKKVQKKEEKASMAIVKWMGDAAAAYAAANSTKGLLPSSLTVTYLAAPRDTSLLRRSSLLVVL